MTEPAEQHTSEKQENNEETQDAEKQNSETDVLYIDPNSTFEKSDSELEKTVTEEQEDNVSDQTIMAALEHLSMTTTKSEEHHEGNKAALGTSQLKGAITPETGKSPKQPADLSVKASQPLEDSSKRRNTRNTNQKEEGYYDALNGGKNEPNPIDRGHFSKFNWGGSFHIIFVKFGI